MKGYGSHAAPTEQRIQGDVSGESEGEGEDKCPRAAESRNGVGDALAESGFAIDDFVGMAHGAHANQLLRGVELASQHPKHFHAGQGLALQENGDVLTVHFDADGLVDGNGVGLVRSLLQHGGEAEELAMRGLVDHDFLMLLIDGGHANAAGHHDVSASGGVTHLVDALAGMKCFHFHLAGQDGGFVVVERGKQRNVLQHFRITCHGTFSQ